MPVDDVPLQVLVAVRHQVVEAVAVATMEPKKAVLPDYPKSRKSVSALSW